MKELKETFKIDHKQKIPLYVHLKDGSPMAFAGLWDSWKPPEGGFVESCTILTTSSNNLIEPLHNRMPVILDPPEYQPWLDRDMTDPTSCSAFTAPALPT